MTDTKSGRNIIIRWVCCTALVMSLWLFAINSGWKAQVSETPEELLPQASRWPKPKASNSGNSIGTPIKAFVFAKTHKTGSTTIRSALCAFIQRNNITNVAQRAPYPFIAGYPGRFKCEFLFPSGQIVDVIHAHSRLDIDEMRKCLSPVAKYFTVLREPWAAFQSAFQFYGKHFRIGKAPSCFGMPVSRVLQGRDLNVTSFMMESARILNKSVPWYFRFRNHQAHDLGFDPLMQDEEEIERKILELDDRMDLVMINEYMDESFVLLKDLLNMEWDDFAVRDKHLLRYNKLQLKSPIHLKEFHTLSNIDMAIYRHFNATFRRKVDQYGRARMEKDLELLRKSRQKALTKVVKRETAIRGFENRRFLIEKHEKIPQNVAQKLAKYMAQNAGSCFQK